MNDRKMTVFPSDLGWMAIVWSGQMMAEFTFGHSSPEWAARAIVTTDSDPSEPDAFPRKLIPRLQAFAQETAAQRKTRARFLNVALDLSGMTEFQETIIQHCREIPPGETKTYGELAALAGRPKAARAVGHVMATNRFPIIVPCHRVVAAQGRLGGYSAPEGLAMKRRLLAAEGVLVGRDR